MARIAHRRRHEVLAAAHALEALERRMLLAGWHHLETVEVPITGTIVENQNTLAQDTDYYFQVGDFVFIGDAAYSDAEYGRLSDWYDIGPPPPQDPEVDMGIEVDPAGAPGLTKSFKWGTSVSPDFYYLKKYTGQNRRAEFQYWDHKYVDNSSSLHFYVHIWAPNPPGPAAVPPPSYHIGGLFRTAPGADGGQTGHEGLSESGVRYSDGGTVYATSDLSSAGGLPWGHTRSWTNTKGWSPDSYSGAGWAVSQTPYVYQAAGDSVLAAVTSASSAYYFDKVPNTSTYKTRYFGQASLELSGTDIVVTESNGTKFLFDGFTATPTARRGRLTSVTDPGGNVSTVQSWTTDGKVEELHRAFGSVTESYFYEYDAPSPNQGLLSRVTLRRKVGSGSWSTVRQVEYEYYSSLESGRGQPGDLKLAVVKDGATPTPNVLETKYYRYYTTLTGVPGYVHGLKYVVEPASFDRMAGDSINPLTADDSVVALYADHYFEYDSEQRVTKKTVKASGNSGTAGGLGTYLYSYSESANLFGVDWWRYKTTETLPDQSTTYVYSNVFGQPLLRSFKPSGSTQQWTTFFKYDAAGRLVMMAEPSAVSGYDEGKRDLLSLADGNYQYIRDDNGLIHVKEYAQTTTAGSSTVGDVAGYLKARSIKRGEAGQAVPQSAFAYIERDAGGPVTYPLARSTVFGSNGGGDPRETNYGYLSWHGSTNQPKKVTITRPAVNTGQNGDGDAETDTLIYDAFGRVTWTKDDLGYLNHTQYDDVTGAVVEEVVDAAAPPLNDPIDRGSNLPTPLELTTEFEPDALGRPVTVTRVGSTAHPDRVTFVRYNDAAHEVRVYGGWDATASYPTGPILLVRDDRARGYVETLTMSPSLSGYLSNGQPTGTEPISNLETVSRNHFNPGGQLISADKYFNLTGLTYTSSTSFGTVGTHLYRTTVGYDERGRRNRLQSPTGTIDRLTYDGLGRPASASMGTDDGGSSNMVTVAQAQYDYGLVGDGTLTRLTEYPGAGQTDRVTTFAYDWRNRLVATKGGVQAKQVERLTPGGAIEVGDKFEVTITDEMGDFATVTATATGTTVSQVSADIYQAISGSSDPRFTALTAANLSTHVTLTANVPGAALYVTVRTLEGDGSPADDQTFLRATDPAIGESDTVPVNRQLGYFEYNNLDQTTKIERYDGDGVVTGDFDRDGVPDRPADPNTGTGYHELLRGKITNDYDSLQRVFRSSLHNINPATGQELNNPLRTENYYDHRGELMATWQPGGIWQKFQYDGALRPMKVFTTDGITGSSWADAASVGTYQSGDNVLTQHEIQYDELSNPIFFIQKERFHDVTGVWGELGDKDGVLNGQSGRPKARVSYSARYYDLADRLTETVNVGTNGGSAYSRPSTVPGRSDNTLVTSYTYNSAGRLEFILHPREVGSPTPTPLRDKYFYDDLGRLTKKIESWTSDLDTARTVQTNRTTEYTYDGADHVLTMTARLPGTNAFQTTEYIYDTAAVSGSDIHSKDLLTKIRYPKKTSPNAGTPDDNEKEQFTYNALGQPKTAKDRNQTTHTYGHDVLGRLTTDSVSVGAGVDDSTLRLAYSFDSAGLPYEFTSYDAASGGNVLNQVRRLYNGFGQITTEYQEHDGAVNTSTSPKVQYTYQNIAAQSQNSSHRLSMIYPTSSANTGVVNFGYSGFAASIGRPSSISDATFTVVEEYSYLGLGSIVKASHPLSAGSLDLTYIDTDTVPGDAGDQYQGLDRFGRVVEQRWQNTNTNQPTDLWTYGYDRHGNVLYRDNHINNNFDELYHADGASQGYDHLDRLAEFQRGPLSDSNSDNIPDTVANEIRNEIWGLDALGNWDAYYLLNNGNFTSEQYRSHNKQNQLSSIQDEANQTNVTLAYDANGNLTTDQSNKTLTYDAWNRLTGYSSANPMTYAYDALGQRILEREAVITFEGSFSIDTEFYYNDRWQVIEEHVDDVLTFQYVWSQRYIDAMVLRDMDTDSDGDLDTRHYVQSDANFNVTALVDDQGTVVERYIYDPYGQRTVRDANWSALTSPLDVSGLYGFKHGHQGGRHDTNSGLMLVRNRSYSPSLGRFVQADPIGYADGMNRYQFVSSNPINRVDPLGLKQTATELVHMYDPNAEFPVTTLPHFHGQHGSPEDTFIPMIGVKLGGTWYETPILGDLTHRHIVKADEAARLGVPAGTDLGPHMHGDDGTKFFPQHGVVQDKNGNRQRASSKMLKDYQKSLPRIREKLARSGVTGLMVLLALGANEARGANAEMVREMRNALTKLEQASRGSGVADRDLIIADILKLLQDIFGSDLVAVGAYDVLMDPGIFEQTPGPGEKIDVNEDSPWRKWFPILIIA